MLNIIMLSVIMQSVIMQNVIMLSVIVQNVIMLSVVALCSNASAKTFFSSKDIFFNLTEILNQTRAYTIKLFTIVSNLFS